ncbi:MAG: hypothetical protein ACYCOR_08535 [Acidobacteriaceae bacterium]
MVHPRQGRGGSQYAWILMVPTVFLGTIFAATTHASHESTTAHQMGTICKFTAGPRAGDTQDYAPLQAPLNAPCQDGAGSSGMIVASAPKVETAVNRQMGTVCKFTAGPKAGTTQDSAPMQAPVDMPCSDGEGSSGTIVATPPVAEVADSPQTGTVCKFTSGPKAGSTHDYAPMHAPLNTACDDGAGSSGVIVAALKMGTVCKFTSGPMAGSTHDYAPMHAPLNTACDDGAGSSGVIVAAPKMGTVCKFTSGPMAGSTHDYAPMHAPLNTACDDGAGSSGVIVAAPKMGTVCKFTSGPMAGSTHDYAPMHSPLGAACDNGAGSSGVIVAGSPAAETPSCTPPSACLVAPNTTAPHAAAPSAVVPSSAAASASAGAPAPGASLAGLGSVCKLTSGPKAGTTYDFAPMQAAIGAPCNYGPDNTGTIIAGPSQPPPAKPVAPAPAMGSVCSFTTGPLALTTADFSPKRAPLGTPCTDGHGSHGVIVVH